MAKSNVEQSSAWGRILLLSDSTEQMVTDGLYLLLTTKKQAWEIVDEEQRRIGLERKFRPEDFGIPQIEALITELEGE